MRTLLPAILALVLVGCSPTIKGPLSFQPPQDWKVAKESDPNFYSVTAKNPDEGLLMLSEWPLSARADEMPALVQQLADGFPKKASTSPEFTLSSQEHRVESFSGEQCQGSYATFQATSTASGKNILLAMFMVSVDGKIWNGQFTGTPDAWKQALNVLKGIKRSG
jgi:hypothetical protein